MRLKQRSISKDTAYCPLKLLNGQAKDKLTQLLTSYSLLTLELGFIKLFYTSNSHDMNVSYPFMKEQDSIHFPYTFFNLGLDLTMLGNSCTNVIGFQVNNLFIRQRDSQHRCYFKVVSSINHNMKVKLVERIVNFHYLTYFLSKKQSICSHIINQLIKNIYLIVLIKFIYSHDQKSLTKLVCNLLLSLYQLVSGLFGLDHSSIHQYDKTNKETKLTLI